jgi:Family of unknown function (DUF6636)
MRRAICWRCVRGATGRSTPNTPTSAIDSLAMKIVVVLARAVGSCAAACSALAVTDFVTPKRAAYCGVSHGEPPFSLICWRPRDGLTLTMYRRSKPGKNIYAPNRGYYDPFPGRLLRFGRTWKVVGYWRCVSRKTGVTCTNSAGHGWWLGRSRGSRLF